MHARIAYVRVDPAQYETARKVLESEILPRVRQASGTVAGYWLEPVEGQGLTIILFDSK